jgi:16S rRNA (cytosine967-C5)-methyltransferase
VAETCRRLGIRSVRAVLGDAAFRLPFREQGLFDRVLLDAPCSGLGILSRHPDGKWNKEASDIPRLAALQRRMLDEAALQVKPGGRLLYAVCTLSRQECEDQAAGFVKDHPELAQADLALELPGRGRELVDEQGFFRAYPHVHGTEGFFSALFVRKTA